MSPTNPRSSVSARRCTRGAAAIEFAITSLFLLIPFLGGSEVGYSAYQAMQVQNAVEAGALHASKVDTFDSTGIIAAVQNATAVTGLTASPAPTQFCGCPTGSGIVAASCSATCAGGNSPGTYVQINATLTRQSLIPGVDMSWLGLGPTFVAHSTVRLY